MKNLKKITAYVLISIVLLSTIIAVLGIWDVIDLEDVLRKIFVSLFVIFIASVIVLFVFSVLLRENPGEEKE